MGKVCFHCGSSSGSFVVHDEKDFCCQGCVAVYDILRENKLYTYYDLENAPGIRQDSDGSADYSYLEQEEIKMSVLDFYDGHLARVRLRIPSIHCSSCIWLLENLSRLHKGILSSQVNFTKKEVSISFNEELIRLPQLIALLDSIHYKPLIREKTATAKPGNSGKSLLIKLGVAGFAFGNVMLLSFPDYLSETISIQDNFIQYFGWVSLVLSIPVLLYSASDYFMSAWKNLRKRTVSIDLPIAIGILTIFLRSTYELFTTSGTGYFDSMTGLVFFLLIGKWYQDKTYQALNFESDYTSYFPLGITLITGEGENIVPIRKLKAGDRIRIRNQEIIPADALLDSGNTLIDYSFITGESVPVKKKRGDRIFAGGRQLGKSVELIVEKEVETSYLAQLWKERKSEGTDSTFVSGMLDKVSRYFTLSILLISAITSIFWLIANPSLALTAFTSVLIVACPCALALSVPFTYGHVQHILGKENLFLRHSSVVEKLASVNTVVLDKTGTLTDNRKFEVTDDFSSETAGIFNAVKALVRHSFHPLSRAIYEHLSTNKEEETDSFNEIIGVGLEGIVGEKHLKIGAREFVSDGSVLQNDNSTRVFVSVNDRLAGSFKIRNVFRDNWKEVVQTLSQDYEFHLLSGDTEQEKSTIQQVSGHPEQLRFQQSPEDKLKYIRRLKSKGKYTLMVGDGLNDAGALRESNVGISVAEDVYQFSPSSDAIIQASAMNKLHWMLKFAKASLRVVWISFVFSFLYNIVGIWYAASGRLSPLVAAVLMPLSSVTIVVLATLLTRALGRKYKLKG